MMIECRDLTTIRRIKHALQLGMLALALLNLYWAVLDTNRNIEKLTEWPRQPAEIISLGGDKGTEIEVPIAFADTLPSKTVPEYCFAYQPGNTCLLLPNNPYAWLSVFDPVEVLQDPEQPGHLEILSMTGFWLPVFGQLLSVVLLALAWHWLSRSGWGEDLTWRNGAWVATESTTQRIGFGGMDAEPIKEAPDSRKAVIFWIVLFLLIAVLAVPAAWSQLSDAPLQAIMILVGGLGMLLLAFYSAAKTYSRVIYQDQTGLLDCSYFGIKRVPWPAIADVKLVNLNQEAQRRYDRKHSFEEDRPATLNVYIAGDRQGREILRLSEDMVPSLAFHALLGRLQRREDEAGQQFDRQELETSAAQTSSSQAEIQADFAAEWDRMADAMQGRRKSLFHPDHRGVLLGLVLMLAPFVLGTAYMLYQSLWFQYGAERAQGQVVEIKHDGLPSLVVEYLPAQGQALRIESDGSDTYGGFHIGDTLAVCYEADNPENARIDLFLELWLGTLIMGGLTAIVLVAAVLIGRGLTMPMPRM